MERILRKQKICLIGCAIVILYSPFLNAQTALQSHGAGGQKGRATGRAKLSELEIEINRIIQTFKQRSEPAIRERAEMLGIDFNQVKTPVIDVIMAKDSRGEFVNLEFLKENINLLRSIRDRDEKAAESYLLLTQSLTKLPQMQKALEDAVSQARAHSASARLVSAEKAKEYIIFVMQGKPENIPRLYRGTFVNQGNSVKEALIGK